MTADMNTNNYRIPAAAMYGSGAEKGREIVLPPLFSSLLMESGCSSGYFFEFEEFLGHGVGDDAGRQPGGY